VRSLAPPRSVRSTTLTTPDTTIKAVVEEGAPFKIIGAQYQKNPIGVVSLAENPIREPEGLINKTLAVPPVNAISVAAMLELNGVDPNQVRIVPYAYDPTPLITERSTPRSILPPTCRSRSSRPARKPIRSCSTTTA
jgi:NMT1/THI5 like